MPVTRPTAGLLGGDALDDALNALGIGPAQGYGAAAQAQPLGLLTAAGGLPQQGLLNAAPAPYKQGTPDAQPLPPPNNAPVGIQDQPNPIEWNQPNAADPTLGNSGSGNASPPSSQPSAPPTSGPPAGAPLLSDGASPNQGGSGYTVPAPPVLNWHRNPVLNFLDNEFLGGAFQKEAINEYKAQLQNYQTQVGYQQAQRIAQVWPTLSPEERKAVLFNAQQYGENVAKNFAPQTAAGGSTTTYFGPGGPQSSAPSYGYDPTTRRSYSVTPQGADIGQQQPMQDVSLVPAGTHPFLTTTGGGAAPPQLGDSGASAAFAGSGPPPDAPRIGGAGSVPRGVRNNNFGNVRSLPNGQMWAGQIGTDPDGYAVFGDAQSGVMATLKNLHSYATKDGISTVAGLVNRWAPASAGNPTGSYANFVATRLGVRPNDKIDLTSPTTLQATAKAIFDFENGQRGNSGAAANVPAGAPLVGGGQAPSGNSGANLPTEPNPRAIDLTPNAQIGSRPMTPTERQRFGIPEGSVAVLDAKGEPQILAAPQYSAKDFSSAVTDLQGSKELENYNKSLGFYSNAVKGAQRPGGIPDVQLTDLAAQQFSGGVSRKFQADMIQNASGPIARLQQFLPQILSGQHYTPQIRQALLTAMHDDAQEKSDAFDRLTASKNALTSRYGFDLAPIAGKLKSPIPDVPNVGAIPDGMSGGGAGGGFHPGQMMTGRGGVQYTFLGGDPTNASNWRAVK